MSELKVHVRHLPMLYIDRRLRFIIMPRESEKPLTESTSAPDPSTKNREMSRKTLPSLAPKVIRLNHLRTHAKFLENVGKIQTGSLPRLWLRASGDSPRTPARLSTAHPPDGRVQRDLSSVRSSSRRADNF